MRRQGCWRRVMGYCLLAAGLPCAGGCLGFLSPMAPAPTELVEACRSLQKCARDHVYVFFVNGLDPLDKDNLTGLRDYVQELGLCKTYFGQMYHEPRFAGEIRRIHQEDPDARFVLVGFSFGANLVCTLAQAVKDEGIQVDFLVYLGGDTLTNVPENRPENALRILNITAHGCIWLLGGYVWQGEDLDGAVNVRLTDVGHAGLPTHRTTLTLLAEGLAEVAASVAIVEPAEASPPVLGDEPTPRPVVPGSSAQRDEWDFLKPISRLSADVRESPGSYR